MGDGWDVGRHLTSTIVNGQGTGIGVVSQRPPSQQREEGGDGRNPSGYQHSPGKTHTLGGVVLLPGIAAVRTDVQLAGSVRGVQLPAAGIPA